jgi:hypothetical protein
VTIDVRRLPILTVLIGHTEYLSTIMAQKWAIFTEYILSETPILQSSTQQLRKNSTKHDKHETKEDHNIEHNRQRIEDGRHQT